MTASRGIAGYLYSVADSASKTSGNLVTHREPPAGFHRL